jgi:hypothetical protein
MYVKPGFPDYAPSGMPDFDEKQFGWGPMAGVYTWCCPVAAADSLWWLDSEFESVKFAYPVPPPTISDHFGLVTSYGGAWDDHDPSNVLGLVTNLGLLMDTDGRRTGDGHTGTRWADFAPGIQAYLVQQGVSGMFSVHSQSFPDFTWIDSQNEAGQGVQLFIEFWQQTGGGWSNKTITNPSWEQGHCVTCAGSDPAASLVLISDPYFDETNPLPPAVHNNASLVSQDPYPVSQWMLGPGPYGGFQPIWELVNYCQINMGLDPSYHAFIRGAVAVSPLVSPVHDVTVTNLTSYHTIQGKGLKDNITVTAENVGNFTENFNVAIYANATIINTVTFNLTSGSSASKVFVWITGLAYGNYVLKAAADQVPGETNIANNNFTYGTIKVTFPGNINGDGVVNLQDLGFITGNWQQTVPPAPANADINCDRHINLQDLGVVTGHWQSHG